MKKKRYFLEVMDMRDEMGVYIGKAKIIFIMIG
jgi:hypothetical protein